MTLTLTNARIVTPTNVRLGSLRIEAGLIDDISDQLCRLPDAIDCEGDYLLPGLVELHTDNLEKHMAPRPKVRWNGLAAAMAHDGQMAAAGITTVYDSIAIGDLIEGSDRLANLEAMIEGVTLAQARNHLRADHHLHLRCEVSCANILALFDALVDHPLVGIVSLMDHTPGQRQFIHEEKYFDYYMGKFHLSRAQMEEFTRVQKENSQRFARRHRVTIAAHCRARGLTLASHDDATLEHVCEAKTLGSGFSEFPTTPAAARAAHDLGIKVMMGAPNLVLGGSHSGNVATQDLAREGLLDFISSDYVPISLIHGVFVLTRAPIFMPLPKACAMASTVPAEIAGLTDRGAIIPGLRADLIRVQESGDVPAVRAVWRGGRQIA